MARKTPTIVAVALNPSWDRTIEVPDLEIGRHVRGRLLSVHAAGKAVNVARLLASLGTPAILTGFVGDGDRDRFAASFAKTGVRVEMFEVADAVTRENVTLVDPARSVDTHIRDAGFPLSGDDLERLRKKLHILAAKGAYVLFTGSLAPGMDAEAFADLLRVCSEKGARVAVDTSGPGLEAVGRVADLWLVKPNRAELAEIAGRPVDSDDAVRAAAQALRDSVDEVVVTLGADGAMLFARAGAWRARSHLDPEAVINTVGAGDAFLAGYVHRHAAGAKPDECLRHGVACGTAATLQLAAGRINPHDVTTVLEKVEVTPLA
ncbi:MAG: 1-phosphofructokinase family hexose kinase [Planctomycetes bacterium]|nr:1-phosphofructokinase family hexose kinase [Planctomycetota bacterium]